jgi:MFS transporter, DHA1 family, multidrug resistance protein
MEIFETIRAPVARLSAKIVRNSIQAIPSDHKGIFATLFFIIFSTVTGVGIVVPLLPIYAHDLGATGIYVAMIFGSFSISRVFLLPYFGRLSDHKGRKPLILAGLISYTLISIAFIFSDTVEGLIFIRFIQGAGSAMIMPVVQAYVGEITPKGSEGYAMGMFNLSMFLSLSLGPLMGGVIHDLWHMNAAFVCMGLLSFTGVLLCVILLPPLSEERLRSGHPPMVIPWPLIIKDLELSALFLFRYAYTACIGAIWCFLPLFGAQMFSLSGAGIGLLVTLGVFISGVLQLPMGYAADRISRPVMTCAGGITATAGMVWIYFAGSFFDLLAAVSVFGVGGGIAMPAISALAVVKGEQKKAMGSVMAVMTVAHSLGMLTGSLTAGLAMDFFNLRLAFPMAGLVMAFGTLVFALVHLSRAVRRS